MDNNIPELKKKVWLLVEAVSELSGHTKHGVVRQFTTSQSFPNGKDFDELKSRWNLCNLRSKLDNQFVKLGYNIFKWYREGIIEKNPPETIYETKIVTEQKEYAPPKKKDGSYDTYGT